MPTYEKKHFNMGEVSQDLHFSSRENAHNMGADRLVNMLPRRPSGVFSRPGTHLKAIFPFNLGVEVFTLDSEVYIVVWTAEHLLVYDLEEPLPIFRTGFRYETLNVKTVQHNAALFLLTTGPGLTVHRLTIERGEFVLKPSADPRQLRRFMELSYLPSYKEPEDPSEFTAEERPTAEETRGGNLFPDDRPLPQEAPIVRPQAPEDTSVGGFTEANFTPFTLRLERVDSETQTLPTDGSEERLLFRLAFSQQVDRDILVEYQATTDDLRHIANGTIRVETGSRRPTFAVYYGSPGRVVVRISTDDPGVTVETETTSYLLERA